MPAKKSRRPRKKLGEDLCGGDGDPKERLVGQEERRIPARHS